MTKYNDIDLTVLNSQGKKAFKEILNELIQANAKKLDEKLLLLTLNITEVSNE